jgi:hypothetical protein
MQHPTSSRALNVLYSIDECLLIEDSTRLAVRLYHESTIVYHNDLEILSRAYRAITRDYKCTSHAAPKNLMNSEITLAYELE